MVLSGTGTGQNKKALIGSAYVVFLLLATNCQVQCQLIVFGFNLSFLSWPNGFSYSCTLQYSCKINNLCSYFRGNNLHIATDFCYRRRRQDSMQSISCVDLEPFVYESAV